MCPERDLCAEGAGLLAPTLRRAVGVTNAQAVSRPGAACTVSWSAGPGRAGREGRLVGCAPLQPSNTPTLPCGLARGKWGLPSCIREGDTGQSPSHQCPGTGRPQNRAPCSLQRPVRADQSASNSAWPVTLLHSWGNHGQAHRAQSAPSQRPCGTHLCLPKCPCPHTELRCPGLRQGLQRRWSGRSWGPLGQHTPLRWQTPPHS